MRAMWDQFCGDAGTVSHCLIPVSYTHLVRDHDQEELSFYSKATSDIEFLFPFGWGELWGIADRTDYDLTQHQNLSLIHI